MKLKFEINGKALLGIALLSAGLAFGEYVSVINAKSAGGVIVNETTVIDTTPIGTVAMWSTNTPPTGWIEMNGQSTSGYPELAAVVGSNVADLRGEFVRGWDNGKGTDSGRSIRSFQGDLIKSHKHFVTTADVFNTSAFSTNDNSGDHIVSSDNTPSTYGNVRTNRYSTELDGGNENRPRNVALMYIIKAQHQN